jgi:hypothetical protein
MIFNAMPSNVQRALNGLKYEVLFGFILTNFQISSRTGFHMRKNFEIILTATSPMQSTKPYITDTVNITIYDGEVHLFE